MLGKLLPKDRHFSQVTFVNIWHYILKNRWSKSLSFKMFVDKCDFLQLSLQNKCDFFNFLVQQKLDLVMTHSHWNGIAEVALARQ